MSLTDVDYELLEAYLDGEMSTDEVAALRTRMTREPGLALAVEGLREDRALRQQAFADLEKPGDIAAGQRVARALRTAVTRDAVWSGRLRILRQVSAAAACIALGLLGGWFARGLSPAASEDATQRGRLVSNHPRDGGGASRTDSSGASLVSNPYTAGAAGPRHSASGGFNVQLTDDAGRVLATQHFESLDEARKFSDDLFRWQQRQRQMRSNGVRLIGDDF